MNDKRTPRIHSIADFRKAVVGVQADTTDYETAKNMQLRGEIAGVKVYPFAGIDKAVRDLIEGRITALMKVEPVASWIVDHTPELVIATQVAHDPQPLGIGVSKDNQSLRTAINQILRQMKRDGSYGRLIVKWGIS